MKYQKRTDKKNSFKIASGNKIKHLRISLTKDMKDLYAENYKTLIKDIEDASTKWKDTQILGLEDLILLKWPYYTK